MPIEQTTRSDSVSQGHTPGHWKAGSSYGNLKTEVVSATTGQALASVWTHAHQTFPEPKMFVEREDGMANLRLIVAAPEMLAEIETLASGLHMLIRAINEGDPRNELRVRAEDMEREAWAMAAKARGDAA